jgi:arginyl-tRNA synthetase
VKNEIVTRIHQALRDVARARSAEGPLPVPAIERPKKPEHGDYATNVALAVSKKIGAKPIEIANDLRARLEADPYFAKVDVAGPGFLNFKLAPAAFHDSLRVVLDERRTFGRAKAATGERINLEFVSANPTGPLHMAHGRGAVTGDAIGRILEAAGHRVTREYYVNDFGNQVKLLVDSVLARAEGRDSPEGGYGGAYVTTMATWAKQACSKLVEARDVDKLAPRLVAAMLEGYPGELGIKQTLRDLGIHFDVWASEAFLHQRGDVDRSIETLREKQFLKEEDGALFFETTRLGDDKDRVLHKRDGGHTYFASDIAYHKDKLDRGFERLIDIWGADHHGYIPRVRAGLRALGFEGDRFEVLLVQMVAILKDGQPYKMGKRIGNFITIDEVLEEIDGATGRKGAGRDALRYFFTSRRSDAQLEIDVEIAKKASLDNPVYYIQYGHARLCNIQRVARDECGLDPEDGDVDLAPLTHPDELAMISHLMEFPEVIAAAAAERAPHKVVTYLTSLAQDFQSYYTRTNNKDDRILPLKADRQSGAWKEWGPEYAAKMRARLSWVRAIRDVYAAGLALVGIGAPERMDRPAADDATTAEDEG